MLEVEGRQCRRQGHAPVNPHRHFTEQLLLLLLLLDPLILILILIFDMVVWCTFHGICNTLSQHITITITRLLLLRIRIRLRISMQVVTLGIRSRYILLKIEVQKWCSGIQQTAISSTISSFEPLCRCRSQLTGRPTLLLVQQQSLCTAAGTLHLSRFSVSLCSPTCRMAESDILVHRSSKPVQCSAGVL